MMAKIRLAEGDILQLVVEQAISTAHGPKISESIIEFTFAEVEKALLQASSRNPKTEAGKLSRAIGVIARNLIRKKDPRGRPIDQEDSLKKLLQLLSQCNQENSALVSEKAIEMVRKVSKSHPKVVSVLSKIESMR